RHEPGAAARAVGLRDRGGRGLSRTACPPAARGDQYPPRLTPSRDPPRAGARLECAPACAILRLSNTLLSPRSDPMASAMVLTEDEALELLAFLITAARTQLDEAAEYGPLRLLTAAGRLADFVAERASPATRTFLTGPFKALPEAVLRSIDPSKYAA